MKHDGCPLHAAKGMPLDVESATQPCAGNVHAHIGQLVPLCHHGALHEAGSDRGWAWGAPPTLAAQHDSIRCDEGLQLAMVSKSTQFARWPCSCGGWQGVEAKGGGDGG